MEKINIELMNEFKYLSCLKENEKQDKLIYVKSFAVVDEDKYKHNIYMYDGKNHIQLTASDKEANFDFLDNDTIYYKTTKNEKPAFYQKSLVSPAEATLLFEFDFNVTNIHKINDDLYILEATYSMDNPMYYTLSKDEKEKYDKEVKEKNFRRIIEEIPFYNDGGSYIEKTRTAIFSFIPSTKEIKNITCLDGTNCSVLDIQNKKVLILKEDFKSKLNLYNEIVEYDIDAKEFTLISKNYAHAYGKYGDKYIYFLATDMKKLGINENLKMFRCDKETKKVDLYLKNDISYANSVGSDARLGSFEFFKVYKDVVYFIATTNYYTTLYKLEDSKLEVLEDSLSSIEDFAFLNNSMYLLAYKDMDLVELYKKDGLEKVSFHNQKVMEDKYVAKAIEIDFNSNGDDIKGFLLLPENFDETKTYPAILDIHGGPATVYGKNYYHEMQVFAAMGYVVMFTNPHGSSGRGNDFSDIRGKYGSIDYEDLMTFVDVVLEKYPNIDKDRLAVTGGSYGGFMTNWIITHTDRFKAAITQRSISNWISMYGVSDIGFYFADDQNYTKLPNEKGFAKIWDHSPLKYVENVKTPTLIIHSAKDYRCPLEQGYQLFTALKDLGIDTKLVMFKEESHGLSRGGKPKARIERLKEITSWMNKYID